MNGLLAMCILDLKRLVKNALFWVLTATLVIIIAVVDFALPREVSEENGVVYAFNTDYAAEHTTKTGSEAELRQAVREKGGIGLIGSADGEITVIHSGLSEKTVRAIMLLLQSHSGSCAEIVSMSADSRVVPFNQRMTPVFICFEALITGFVLGGALMLSEKEERTMRALRVSPMGVDRYLLSKTLLFSGVGTVYALLIAFFCIGFRFPILQFILLSFFGAAVFSLIGLAFTSLFRDISSWFFGMVLILAINMLPAVAYSEPSFSPLWLRVIPSYPMIFTYERLLFNKGGNGWEAALAVAGWSAGAYLLGRFMAARYLFSAGRR